LPTPIASDATRGPHWNSRTGASLAFAVLRAHRDSTWDAYLPAIQRWETVTSAEAPPAVEPNKHGRPRISIAFVIWMMGWPAEWLTGSRVSQLTLLGNGVVPQQAKLAIEGLGIVT